MLVYADVWWRMLAYADVCLCNGILQIGVHISDVSFFVEPGDVC